MSITLVMTLLSYSRGDEAKPILALVYAKEAPCAGQNVGSLAAFTSRLLL